MDILRHRHELRVVESNDSPGRDTAMSMEVFSYLSAKAPKGKGIAVSREFTKEMLFVGGRSFTALLSAESWTDC